MTRFRWTLAAGLAVTVAVLPVSAATAAGSISGSDSTRILAPLAGGNLTSNAPWAIALSPDDSTLFAVDYFSGDLSAHDLAAATVSTLTTGEGGAYSIGVVPDGRIVVGARTTAQLGVYTATPALAQTGLEPAGFDPRGIAAAPDGRVYVTDRDSNTVMIYSNALVFQGTFPAGPFPTGIAISPDGSVLAVTNGNATVDLFEVTGTFLATIPVAAGPWFVTFSPDNSTAWVASYDSNVITPIDVATHTAGSPLTVGAGPAELRVSPDGRWLYVMVDTDSEYVVIDLATRTVASRMPAAIGFPFSLAMRSDGSRLYSGSGASTDIVPLDPTDLTLTFTAADRIDPGTSDVTVAVALDDTLPVNGDYSGGTVTVDLLDASSTVVASSPGTDAPDAATGLADVLVPTASLPAGTYTMQVTWTNGRTTLSATAGGFSIAEVLPPTGADTTGNLALAAALLGLGAVLVAASRLRARQEPAAPAP